MKLVKKYSNNWFPEIGSPKGNVQGTNALRSKTEVAWFCSGRAGTSREPVGTSGNQWVIDPLGITCLEEAEALKAAPPWAGVWSERPTVKQRLLVWIKWLPRVYAGLYGRGDYATESKQERTTGPPSVDPGPGNPFDEEDFLRSNEYRGIGGSMDGRHSRKCAYAEH